MDQLPTRRTPTEREMWVSGFAFGWKQCLAELDVPDALKDEMQARLDDHLDLLSAVENTIREVESR